MGPDYRQDVTASFYAKRRVFSVVSIQPEIGWVSKGGQGNLQLTVSSSDEPPTVYHFHHEHRVAYIEMPMLLRIDVPALGWLQTYVVAGPAPALRVGDGKTTVESSSSTGSARAKPAAEIFEDVGTFDSPLKTRTFDLGAVGGAGFWFGRGPLRLGLEARYVHGLLDAHPSDQAEMQNGAFIVTTAIELR